MVMAQYYSQMTVDSIRTDDRIRTALTFLRCNIIPMCRIHHTLKPHLKLEAGAFFCGMYYTTILVTAYTSKVWLMFYTFTASRESFEALHKQELLQLHPTDA